MNIPQLILTQSPWNQITNPIWPVTCFFLHRNLKKYAFPSKLSQTQSEELLNEFKGVFSNLDKFKDASHLPAEFLNAQEKDFLSEYFLDQEGWQNISRGQSLVIDPSAQFLALLNFKDHLLLQLIDYKGEWNLAWNRINTVEENIGKLLNYAFCPRFGYLTSDHKKSGLGLFVSCYLHLPGLIAAGLLPSVLKTHNTVNTEGLGLLGNTEEMIGDFLILKNKCSLGLTEESILNDLYKTATQLVSCEQEQRQIYKENTPSEIKDSISRAYGLLTHSYQLDTKEALNALSQLKLGVYLGLVIGISDENLNELFFKCRRAHLSYIQEKTLSNKIELARARASYLHEKLKNVTLTF